MAKHSTIRDVARIAGVSIATVSRTLSNPDIVAEGTREAVLKAVVATGYSPNSMAISLRQMKSRSVVVMVSDISNPFYSDVFKGAEEEARKHGYSVLIGDLSNDPEFGASYVDMVRGRRADGIVMMSAHPPSNIGAGFDFPFVYASSYDPEGKLASVSIDYVAAAKSAVDHLIELGHHRIGHISGEMDSHTCRDKVEGYRLGLKSAGIDPNGKLEFEGDNSIESGFAGANYLFDQEITPTAIFASNDEMAIGVIQALVSKGMSVPQDCSVVGFDDIKFAGAYMPAITTVRMPRFDIGRLAMELIINQLMLDQYEIEFHLLPTEIIVRQSTAPPN